MGDKIGVYLTGQSVRVTVGHSGGVVLQPKIKPANTKIAKP